MFYTEFYHPLVCICVCIYLSANPCAKLGRPANGNITCTGEQVTGESCDYTCDPGYSLQGSDGKQ